MAQKRVLIACGTSIATATHAANSIMELAKEANLDVETSQCKSAEIRGKIQTFSPHVIIAMTPVPSDLGIPVFSGVPFLSGIGLDQLKAEVLEALQAPD
jgi:PTS system galactitol-specific IIB component